jgi:glycosyltransferase involved in cell wall biosynthesis
MPKVSVIIPAYNQSRYLSQAVSSVLAQSMGDWEALIVDDGSTDNTGEVARSFSDPRIRYIYQENRGLSGARNTGIRNSAASYISFLDSDDLFLPQKLELLLGEMERHPEIGLAAGQAIPVNEEGRVVGKTFSTPLPERGERLLLGNPLHVGSVLLRREWQERAGFFDETLRSYEDWEMWLRLALLGCPMGCVAQPVSQYRFHTAQMTRLGHQMTHATFSVLDKVFAMPNLPANWLELKDQAYSRAYLRAAAQAYHAGDVPKAKAYLEQAIDLDPGLLPDGAAPLAAIFRSWLDLPKTAHPLDFLERIYANLPDSLGELRFRRRTELGNAAIQLAFEAYQRGDLALAYDAVRGAFSYQPKYLLNRGALVIYIRSRRASRDG